MVHQRRRAQLMSGVLTASIPGPPGQINGSLPNGGATDTTGSWGINNNGTYTISTGQSGDWVTPATSGIASQYEVMVTPTSGTFDGGSATGVWLACSTSRGWTVSDPGGLNVATVVFNVSFRPVGGATQSTQTGVQLSVTSTS